MQECDRQWIVKVLRIPDWISRRRRYYSPAQKRYFTREESSGRPWNIVGPRAQCLAGKEVRMDFRLRESSSIEKWIDNPVLDAGKPDSFPRAPPNASDVHIFGGQHPDLSTIYIASIPSAGFDRDWRIGRPEAAEELGWTAVTLWGTRFLDASLGKNNCRRIFSWTLFPDWRIGRLEAAELLAERLWLCGALGSLMLLWAKTIVSAHFQLSLYSAPISVVLQNRIHASCEVRGQALSG